jgi:hypothetical protein
MNRRNILSISAITVLGLSLLPGSATAQQKSLKEQLVGTWTLVSWEQDVANGPKFQRYGTSPKGDNIMMFARPDLPKLASGNPATPTPDESKAIVSGAIGLFGTYIVDEAATVVSLRIEACTFPNQMGTRSKTLGHFDHANRTQI